MAISTSRLNLKLDVLRRLGTEAYFLGPAVTTSAGTTTTLLDNVRLAVAAANADYFDGRIMEVLELEGAGPAIGEFARCTDFTTATLTFTPALTLAPQSGMNYTVYPLGYSPAHIHDAFTRVLRATEGPHLWAPTLIANGDMDVATLTDYPAVGAPGTRAFVTTAANIMPLFGERALQLITTATGQGAETLSVNVTENETLYTFVFVSVTVGDLSVILRDQTAGANVTPIATGIDEPMFTEVSFVLQAADNMEEARVRFVSDTVAASTFYISPPVILQSGHRRIYTAPSWLIGDQQIIDVGYLPQGFASEDPYSFMALTEPFRSLTGFSVLRNDRAATPLAVEFRNMIANRPIVLKVMRAFADLTTDAGTTVCDRNYLADKATSLLFADKATAALMAGDPGQAGRLVAASNAYAGKARAAAERLGYGGPRAVIENRREWRT